MKKCLENTQTGPPPPILSLTGILLVDSQNWLTTPGPDRPNHPRPFSHQRSPGPPGLLR
ncbi:hypothetical protein S-CBS2_gp081 [Synechococcus phage S-CBS2]|uniref:hypothetical protein n=1 Tax=Synechococcus phage S-CBS2 TaxID=753084 RepID=UPI000207842A|nr:hypothetical protein S-CBS2_gp081 [Synechococcus phage S-CBS2]ADF42437.1 hypothetical protein S-CBS2_gp081 [Synechococcus phage S-CBS2]